VGYLPSSPSHASTSIRGSDPPERSLRSFSSVANLPACLSASPIGVKPEQPTISRTTTRLTHLGGGRKTSGHQMHGGNQINARCTIALSRPPPSRPPTQQLNNNSGWRLPERDPLRARSFGQQQKPSSPRCRSLPCPPGVLSHVKNLVLVVPWPSRRRHVILFFFCRVLA